MYKENKRGMPICPYCGEEAVDSTNSLSEQVISSLQAGVMSVGLVRPEANAPTGSQELTSAKRLLSVCKR